MSWIFLTDSQRFFIFLRFENVRMLSVLAKLCARSRCIKMYVRNINVAK